MEEEICLIDNTTTNTIIREDTYFQTLNKKTGNTMTIARSNAHIVGTGRDTFGFPMVTKIVINEILLHPESKRTLLSFKDIRANGCHGKLAKCIM